LLQQLPPQPLALLLPVLPEVPLVVLEALVEALEMLVRLQPSMPNTRNTNFAVAAVVMASRFGVDAGCVCSTRFRFAQHS
jgi:hypothetical protein